MREYDPTILRFVRMLLDRIEEKATSDTGLFRDEDFGLCGELVRLAGFELIETKRGVLDRIASSGNPSMGRRVAGTDNPITNMRFTCANAPDDFVTKWFEWLVRRIVSEVTHMKCCEDSSGTKLLTWGWEFVDREVVRAHPFKPIPLTGVGDAMGENWPISRDGSFFVTHQRDADVMPPGALGVHAVCGGVIKYGPTTLTHNALWCTTCHLRVPFSRAIGTYGELRAHFEGVLHL